MTAHDGLGSVRADRRKDAAERGGCPESRGVDVAEGRRRLASMSEETASVERLFVHHALDQVDALAIVWLRNNAAALLDAAEERDAALRLARANSAGIDAALARESKLREAIEAKADQFERDAKGIRRATGDVEDGCEFETAAAELRALLSPEAQP